MRKLVKLSVISVFVLLMVSSCEKQDIQLPVIVPPQTAPTGAGPSAYTTPSCSSLSNNSTNSSNVSLSFCTLSSTSGPNNYTYKMYHAYSNSTGDYVDVIFPVSPSGTVSSGNYNVVNPTKSYTFINNNEVMIRAYDYWNSVYYYFHSGTCNVNVSSGIVKINACNVSYAYNENSTNANGTMSVEVTY